MIARLAASKLRPKVPLRAIHNAPINIGFSRSVSTGSKKVLYLGMGCTVACYTSSQTAHTEAAFPMNAIDEIKKMLGFVDPVEPSKEKEAPKDEGAAEEASASPVAEGKVVVDLDPEVVAALPVISLEEVRKHDGLHGERLLATYEGIVYDVTSFADHHPGGRELLRTAAGLDLGHFFDNYKVPYSFQIFIK